MTDLISRQETIKEFSDFVRKSNNSGQTPTWNDAVSLVGSMPSAEPEKEISRRVLWSGWKGFGDTRYQCPRCNKLLRADDAYCRKCGQKLIFPRVSFTPYIEGQKQEAIVRWDDEE